MKDLSNTQMIQTEKNGVFILQFRNLKKYEPEFFHGYTMKDLDFRKGETYLKNVEALQNAQDVHGLWIKTKQTHSDHIAVILEGEKVPQFLEDTDGVITNQKNLLVLTSYADCTPIVIYDPKKQVVANIHSGWRGTLQRISVKTVQKMIKEFGSNPQDIICCICPSIRKCHFQVDKDVKDMFEKEFDDLANIKFIDIEKENQEKTVQLTDFIEEKIENTKWNIDTVLINKILLQKEGLKPENIIDSGICSVCHSDIIHSYRIEKKDYNTETAVIELK